MISIIDNPLEIAFHLGWVSLMLGGLILLLYVALLLLHQNDAGKYEFTSAHEVKTLKLVSAVATVGVAAFLYYFVARWLSPDTARQYYLTGIIIGTVAFLGGYMLWSYVGHYYPFVLERRLTRYRFHPRRSPVSNKFMRLQNENEEYIHLEKYKLKGERLGKDYDIWVDDVSGFRQVEEYDEHYHALLCDNCGLRTSLDYREEIMKYPAKHQSGVLRKHYRCTNCGYREAKEATILSFEDEKEIMKMKNTLQEVIHVHPK